MGVVYHANYLVWFEVGRVEFIRQLGLDYKAMEREEGCGIAVVDGVLLCEGETVHVVVGPDMKKRSLPQKYAERFAACLI